MCPPIPGLYITGCQKSLSHIRERKGLSGWSEGADESPTFLLCLAHYQLLEPALMGPAFLSLPQGQVPL